MEKEINNNGYEYVDLGLPSGTLWAAQNVGASKPSDAGLYFQWGDTQGYTVDQVGTGNGQKKFASDWSDYKWGIIPNFTKYTTPGEALDLEDDAANAYMGGDWHIPSPEQIQELLDNTTTSWEAYLDDGISGMVFISKKDTSKSIFFPSTGYALDGSIDRVSDYGGIWISMISMNGINYGKYIYFYSEGAYLNECSRYHGFPVRGVIG